MTYIANAVRIQVITRARESCEYCLVHADYAMLVHEVDHIIAQKHGGASTIRNLAYACAQCNRFKGSDLSSLDPKTGELVSLFNPRIHTWWEHFELDGPRIMPLYASGRATDRLLQLNQVDRLLLRKELIAAGRYPFQFGK
jgi:hypothetical protein